MYSGRLREFMLAFLRYPHAEQVVTPNATTMQKTGDLHHSLHLHLGLGKVAAPNVFDGVSSFGRCQSNPVVQDVVFESIEKIGTTFVWF